MLFFRVTIFAIETK